MMPGPRADAPRRPGRRTQRILLAAAAAAFVLVWAIYFPPMYLASDEAGNLALAGVLGEGAVFADVADRHLPIPVPAADGHRASRYPPGLAAMLVPFTAAGTSAAFLLPLVLHLLIFALLAWLLGRAGLSPLWALLYLFHPTAALHSRTLMSNLPAAALLLAAFALLVRGGAKSALAAGLLVGLGTLLRQPLLLAGVVLGLGALWRGRGALLAGSWRERLRSGPALFALGVIPGLALYAGYHWYVFGSPFRSGYSQVGAYGYFTVGALLVFLPRYALILLAIYPLMLVTPAFYRGKWKVEVLLLPLFYLLFYGSFRYFDSGATLAQTVVRAPRFLLPAAPFFVLAYAGVFSPMLRRLPGLERAALLAAGVLGLAGSTYVFHRHHQAQSQQAAIRDALYANTEEGALLVCSVESAELLQDFWGRRTVMDYAERDWDRLAAHLDSGRPAYFVNVFKREDDTLHAWGTALRRELAGRFDLEYRGQPVGRWRLELWRLQPARDKAKLLKSPSPGLSWPKGRREAGLRRKSVRRESPAVQPALRSDIPHGEEDRR